MSDLNQINTALERLFNEEGQRIVFWNDPDQEFQNTLPFLMLDGVTTLRLDEVGALEAKIRLERDEPDRQVPALRPHRRTRLRRRLAARHPPLQPQLPGGPGLILLEELGLVNQHLRHHLADRRKFFDAKERLQKIKNSGRRRRRRRRPRPQDDRRGRQGRPAGTVQPRADALPRLDRGRETRSTWTIRPPSGSRSRSSTWTRRSGRW